MTTSLTPPLSFLYVPSSHAGRAWPNSSPITFSHRGSEALSSLNLSSKSGRQRLLRRHSPIMSFSTVTQSAPIELSDESDFHSLLSPSGLISICGFGSLLSGTYNHHHYHFLIQCLLYIYIECMYVCMI